MVPAFHLLAPNIMPSYNLGSTCYLVDLKEGSLALGLNSENLQPQSRRDSTRQGIGSPVHTCFWNCTFYGSDGPRIYMMHTWGLLTRAFLPAMLPLVPVPLNPVKMSDDG